MHDSGDCYPTEPYMHGDILYMTKGANDCIVFETGCCIPTIKLHAVINKYCHVNDIFEPAIVAMLPQCNWHTPKGLYARDSFQGVGPYAYSGCFCDLYSVDERAKCKPLDLPQPLSYSPLREQP